MASVKITPEAMLWMAGYAGRKAPAEGVELPAAEATTLTPAPVGDAPAPAVDPAVIARQNLLERLRAARTSAGTGPRGR